MVSPSSEAYASAERERERCAGYDLTSACVREEEE